MSRENPATRGYSNDGKAQSNVTTVKRLVIRPFNARRIGSARDARAEAIAMANA